MIRSLTGLRAVAAFLVFVFHASVFSVHGVNLVAPGFDNGIVRNGDFGVDIFFVLSGYVIALVYIDRFREFSPGLYLKFIWYRIARLLPLHLLTMLAMLVAFYVSSIGGVVVTNNIYEFEPQSIISSIFLIHEWLSDGNFVAKLPPIALVLGHIGRVGTPNSVAWSISAEFLAYLSFPILLFVATKFRGAVAQITLLVAAIAMGCLHLVPTDNLLRVLLCFSAGVILLVSGRLATNRVSRIQFRGFGLCLAAGLGYLMANCRTADGGLTYLMAVALVVALVGALARENDILASILATRAPVYLGEISYAFYMVHWIVLKALTRLHHVSDGISSIGSIAFIAENLAVCLFLAGLLHKYVEGPARAALQGAYVRRFEAVRN